MAIVRSRLDWLLDCGTRDMSVRMSEDDLTKLLQSRSTPPVISVPAKTTSQQRMQALGRLKTGELNKTEQRYANHLAARLAAGEIKWFKFDCIKLRLADNTFLEVDFAVLRADDVLEMVDVKGAKAVYQDDARVKNKVAAETYPFVFKVAYPRAKAAGGGWDEEEV